MYNLSKRLGVIASLVKQGARVCDVGTDHGYLPIVLKKSGLASSVIATDLREGPLSNAAENIALSGVNGIELRLCDGLDSVSSNETDTVVIAGMGGEVISGIIARCDWLKNDGITLILQPTTSPEFLRRFLYSNGFEIQKEPAVIECGKAYSVMKVRFTGKAYALPEHFYYIGKVDTLENDGIEYLNRQYKRCKNCADALANNADNKEKFNYYKSVAEKLREVIGGEESGI